jgi:hypothetical protein
MGEPNDRINLSEEVRSGPASKIKTELGSIRENLIKQYEYHPEKTPPEEEVLASEHNLELSKSYRGIDLYDLNFFCEERIRLVLSGPIETKAKKILFLEKKLIRDKLEIYAEYSKEVELQIFKDSLYYFKGEILLPEEYILLSGFLRKYFKVEHVYILYRNGGIKLENAKYCNFWFDEKLQKLFSPNPNYSSKAELLSDNSCRRCNLECPFRGQQQMS